MNHYIRVILCALGVCGSLFYIYVNEYKEDSTKNRPKNYVTVSCNGGRLGNQIWPVISGWGISKSLNRKFYINCNDNFATKQITLIRQIFPKLAETFDQFNPMHQISLPLTNSCCSYNDPKIYMDRPEKFIRLQVKFAQNARFFYDHRKELEPLLELGPEITEKGERIIIGRELNTTDDIICAHIRQADFREIKWSRTLKECLSVIELVASTKAGRTLVMFGDDSKFMANLISKLVTDDVVANNSFYSNYTSSEDLYLSRRLCKTFIATAEVSSFGFWLAYLSGNHDNVYYVKEERPNVRPTFDENFPLPWHPIRISANGTVTIL